MNFPDVLETNFYRMIRFKSLFLETEENTEPVSFGLSSYFTDDPLFSFSSYFTFLSKSSLFSLSLLTFNFISSSSINGDSYSELYKWSRGEVGWLNKFVPFISIFDYKCYDLYSNLENEILRLLSNACYLAGVEERRAY
jgi:hypothetical protein